MNESHSNEQNSRDDQVARWMNYRRKYMPPENILPAAWPFTLTLASSDQAGVGIVGGQVYPNGLAFEVRVLLRLEDAGNLQTARLFSFGHQIPGMKEMRPTEILRLGFRFADGRTVTNLDEPLVPNVFVERDNRSPRITPVGGSGSGRTWHSQVYLAPLPPDGPLEIACEWHSFGIPETRATVDVTGLSAVAASLKELWPDEPPREFKPRPLKFGDAGDSFFRPIINDK